MRQAGGVMWPWKDGDNYYVARANALENNVSLYYTLGGNRKTLKYAGCAGAAETMAHAARLLPGNEDQVTFNGKTYIELEDDHIKGAGAVGVWTKADNVTAFDGFSYGPPK